MEFDNDNVGPVEGNLITQEYVRDHYFEPRFLGFEIVAWGSTIAGHYAIRKVYAAGGRAANPFAFESVSLLILDMWVNSTKLSM